MPGCDARDPDPLLQSGARAQAKIPRPQVRGVHRFLQAEVGRGGKRYERRGSDGGVHVQASALVDMCLPLCVCVRVRVRVRVCSVFKTRVCGPAEGTPCT